MKHTALIIGTVFAALFLTSCSPNKGSFSLVNRTKESIVRASVAICGQKIDLKDIQPNESTSRSYDVKSDSHYIIEIEFRSGKKLQKETGYVTNGMDFWHEITITESDIEVVDSKAK